MNRLAVVVTWLVVLLAVATSVDAQNCQKLHGNIGAAARWGSAWLDLAPPINFRSGDKLRLLIGGDAKRVLVRLLPSDKEPDDEVGIVGDYSVKPNQPVEVPLTEDQRNIKQISVHGGPNPWGHNPLGGGNGAATLRSVERCPSP